MGNCCGGEAKPAQTNGAAKGQNAAPAKAVPPVAKKKLTHMGSILQREVEELHHTYTQGKELGRGQFGITTLCRNIETKEMFACKSISKQRKIITAQDAEDVRREIGIMYHLNGHPNICELKGVYEDKANVHLVMELAEGGELFDRIVEKGHYSEKLAANTFRTIMQVVAQCHALGVMHRDLKPENFLLSTTAADAEIKATDFGLSVFFKPNQTFREVVGSAFYVAPEVLKRFYGPEADVWSAGVILYILLSGVPPFWHETEAGIFDAVRKGQFDTTSPPWNKISKGAKELVHGLLNSNPKTRLTAQEALRHPWLREGGEAPDTVLDDTVLTRLKKFSGMNKLKKMALNVIAKNMSKHEIEGLSEMFKTFDKDNSGTITLLEMKEGLKKMGNPMSESEVEAMMTQIDVDGNGEISYEEFIAATMHMNKLNSDENLFKAFSTFDTDESGYITHDELLDALKAHGMDIEGVDQILKDVDTDNDGKIDYNEFVQMMRSNNPVGAGLDLGAVSLDL